MIVTFFSYKGGTGRTMALANIAALLAKRKNKVLVVDFDLEAPGLWRYFSDFHLDLPGQSGVIDLLTEACKVSRPLNLDWHAYVTRIELDPSPGFSFELSMMTSGRQDKSYASKVLTFDWNKFFDAHQGGDFLQRLRIGWKSEYDFVLIDSRTGITDSGGICTIMLPDVIVPVFSPNMQNLDGLVDVITRAQARRMTSPYDSAQAAILPVLARFDGKQEHQLGQEWLDRSAEALASFYAAWLPQKYSPRQALDRMKLPYVAYFSFGEKLPAFAASRSSLDSLGYALNLVSQFIESGLQDIDAIMGESPALIEPAVESDPRPSRADAGSRYATDIKADGQITILGAPASGKTTFLAAVPIALARYADEQADQQWNLIAADEASREALAGMTTALTVGHTFPVATPPAVERYRWLLTGRLTRTVKRRWRRPRQIAETAQLSVEIADTSGKIVGAYQTTRQARDDLIDNLVHSRGLIFMFDPVGESRTGNGFAQILNVLAELEGRMVDDPDFAEGVLPHYVAVCISKFDSYKVILTAERSEMVEYDGAGKYGFPNVPGDRAREFFLRLYNIVGAGDAELVLQSIEKMFHKDRVRYFVVSAIGFYVDPSSNKSNPDDRSNVQDGGAARQPRIRGGIHPINVAEPFLWLGKSLRGSSRS